MLTPPPPLQTHTHIPFHTVGRALLQATEVQRLTWVWVVTGSRHLDIVEGDRERSQRREGAASQLPRRPFKYHLKEREEGKKSGKCFSNLSPVTRCLHGVIKGHLVFLPWRGKRPENLGAGALRGKGSGSEGWKLKRRSSTNHLWAPRYTQNILMFPLTSVACLTLMMICSISSSREARVVQKHKQKYGPSCC